MEELSPKELYEKEKRAKSNAESRSFRARQFKKFLILILILAAAAGSIFWLIRRSREKAAQIKLYAVQIIDQGRDHINVGAPHPGYNSNPPTSGWHYAEPAPKGIYDKQLPDEQLIHNLEHGYVWISYRPDAHSNIVRQLENFAGYGKKIILEPRRENDKTIALAAWNWLDKFDPESNESLNDAESKRVRDFIDAYINQGPEPNAP